MALILDHCRYPPTPGLWTHRFRQLSLRVLPAMLTVIVGALASGSVSLIVLILTIIVAWNYIKLLFEAAERYIMVGVLIYTAPMAFETGASESTSNIFSAWGECLGGQLFLLVMNAWCLRLFVSMVGGFIANPLSLWRIGGNNARELDSRNCCPDVVLYAARRHWPWRNLR